MFLDMQSEKSPDFGEDTVYQFMSTDHINWKKYTTLLSGRIIRDTIVPTISTNRKCAVIIDDSVYGRNGSKHVELLAKIFDHANKKYLKGFRMLTLDRSDGVTYMPDNSRLLSSENPDTKINEAEGKSRLHRIHGQGAGTEATTEGMPELIKGAQRAEISA